MIRHTIIATATAMAVACSATFAAEPADTLLHATDVDMLITETPEQLRITASDSTGIMSWIEKYPDNANVRSRQRFGLKSATIRSNKNTYWDVTSSTLLLGFVDGHGAPAALDLEMGHSLEISWLNALAVSCNFRHLHSSVSLGVGFGWRNYRTTTGMRFVTDDSGLTSFEPFAPDASPRYSRIKTFSLSFPLLYTQNFRLGAFKNLGIQFGPVLNWNSHGSLATRWYDADGRKMTESTNRVDQRRFSVDIFGALRLFPAMGLYVRYSPQSVLCNAPGLDFTTLSTGIVLGI